MQLHTGTIIDRRYKILRYISSGGFGNTYEAYDMRLNTRVAIKELFMASICNRNTSNNTVVVSVPNNKTTFESHKRKFIKEARRLCGFTHTNIVRVTDVFESNGTAYYVMDYIDGCPLSQFPKPMSESVARLYLEQILNALEHVHNHNILHLDIKPGNIMIDDNNNAILIDFGASKVFDSEGDSKNDTSSSLAYTPGYAPLEQIQNKSINDIGPFSDIYALGATLYTLLKGERPPGALEILESGSLPPIEGVSPSIKKVIEQSMTVTRNNRIASIAEFRKVLGCVITEEQRTQANNETKEIQTEIRNRRKENEQRSKELSDANAIKGHEIETPEEQINETLIDNSNNKKESQDKTDIKNKLYWGIGIIALIIAVILIVIISSSNNSSETQNIVSDTATVDSSKVTSKPDSSQIIKEEPVKENTTTKTVQKNEKTKETKKGTPKTKSEAKKTTTKSDTKQQEKSQQKSTSPKQGGGLDLNLPDIDKMGNSSTGKPRTLNLPDIDQMENTSQKPGGKVNLPNLEDM